MHLYKNNNKIKTRPICPGVSSKEQVCIKMVGTLITTSI
jgi:hypothetical protein